MSNVRGRPQTWRQWALPGLVGLVIGAGVVLIARVASGLQIVHPGLAGWTQVIANIALVVAAIIAGWAALIARAAFRSQTTTADRQLQLADAEAARQEAADRSTRHHASIQLAVKFSDAWEAEKMLRWRAELADGLLERGASGGDLAARSRLALGQVANFIDFVGYCARKGLLLVEDAWNIFSYHWEIYWAQSGEFVRPDSSDVAGLWENANWLIEQFVAREPGGKTLQLSDEDVTRFLTGERNIAAVEQAVLEAARHPESRGPSKSGPA